MHDLCDLFLLLFFLKKILSRNNCMHNGAVCVSGDFNVNEKNVALQAFTNQSEYGKRTVSSGLLFIISMDQTVALSCKCISLWVYTKMKPRLRLSFLLFVKLCFFFFCYTQSLGLSLFNAREVSRQVSGFKETFTGWSSYSPSSSFSEQIDHIFVRTVGASGPLMKVDAYNVPEHLRPNCSFISDHRPVIIDVRLLANKQ